MQEEERAVMYSLNVANLQESLSEQSIFVTGAAGFIGSNLITLRLLKVGARVVVSTT